MRIHSFLVGPMIVPLLSVFPQFIVGSNTLPSTETLGFKTLSVRSLRFETIGFRSFAFGTLDFKACKFRLLCFGYLDVKLVGFS